MLSVVQLLIVFFDMTNMTKAFDKVNHCALYCKFMHCKIPVQFLNVLINWYNRCYSAVKLNNVLYVF